MKRYILSIILFFATLASFADEVTFVVKAPDAVALDNHFRVSYTVNRGNVKEPHVTFDDFDVLSGPNRSTSMNMYSVNGQSVTSHTVTFNYILKARNEGTFKLPVATIDVDGKQYKSNSANIKVLPADKAASAANSNSGVGNGQRAQISKDELFMTATLNRSTVYEQEAVLLTYKVYSLVNLTNLNGKMPDLKGFQIQEVQLPQNKGWGLEHYNGRNYRVITWSQYVLFPQQSGEIEIPSVEFEGVVAMQSPDYNPFDFFGGSRYVEVKRKLVTPKLTLDVKELPSGKPVGYSGAVGRFDITGTISTNELKANEAVTLRLMISGTGNMKLIKTPEVAFPEDFELYDPKVDNKFKLTTNGFQGNKVIEYLAIPRHGGEYTIPPVKFTYFDTDTKQYRTVETASYTLKVAKGSSSDNATVASYVSKEELKMLGQDIRYIKTGNVKLNRKNSHLYASLPCIMWYLIPVLCFIIYIALHYKQMSENANVARMRTKKANKVAVKRLKAAKKLLGQNRKDAFYDELLKALWGYLSDKLSIPVSRLTKDNVAQELSAKGVEDELIGELAKVLGEVEFARYAPGDSNAAMDNVYKMAIDVIGKMENRIRR